MAPGLMIARVTIKIVDQLAVSEALGIIQGKRDKVKVIKTQPKV